MARQIPDDLLLVIHLTIALFHLAGSGVFALSLAYERDAARLRWMATRDTLTGLLNRDAFEERVSARLADGSEDAAILMIDMDHFKQINDVHGHAAGDEALKTCAAVLLDCLGTEALAARWGGEEFAAMLPGVSADEAQALAERLRHQIGQAELGPQSNRFSTSVSVGICHTTTGLRQFDLLMRQADAALYAAKANGRNRAEMAAA